MIDEYWSNSKLNQSQVINNLRARAYGALDLEAAPTWKVPTPSTVRRWLSASETYERYKTRYTKRAADRRYRGRSHGLNALQPLEYVLLDSTECDTWLIVIDTDGKEIGRFRPYLVTAIDLFSHLTLGFFLSFEPPSVLTLMACLKAAMKPNTSIIEKYGAHKGSTDGYGKIQTLVLDNGKEHIGTSLRASIAALGIKLKLAPLRTPEFKAEVERILGTINTSLWHRMRGGIPYKPSEMAKKQTNPRKRSHPKSTSTSPRSKFTS